MFNGVLIKKNAIQLKNKKKRVLIAGSIILLIAVYYYWWILHSGDVLITTSKNEPNRKALVEIYETITPGDSYESVLQAYWLLNTKELRLHATHPEQWLVKTPFEFGASNWMLWIDFSDGHVIALRIREEDGPAPENGPPDKGNT